MFNKQSFLFGMGTGLIFVALVFYTASALFAPNDIVAQSYTPVMTEEEIIQRAEELGMVHRTAVPTPEEPSIDQIPPEDVIARAFELGMVFWDDTVEDDYEEE